MFMWHNITPKEFFAKGEGERKLLHAFTAYEIKHRKARDEIWAKFFAKLFGAKIE